MGSEYFIDKDHGMMCVQESGGTTWSSRWVASRKNSKKCTLTPFFSVREMYSDPIFWVYKWSKRICIRNINIADSCGVLA